MLTFSIVAELIGLTSTIAVGLAKFGLRVNATSPGRIEVTHENKDADRKGDGWGIGKDDMETR